MPKPELIERVANRLNHPASEAEKVVNTIFDSMATSLSAGERIEIPGFGVFDNIQHDKTFTETYPIEMRGRDHARTTY